jgi:hypothetical protein
LLDRWEATAVDLFDAEALVLAAEGLRAHAEKVVRAAETAEAKAYLDLLFERAQAGEAAP